ncbi:hypothetical protein M446_1469 [Methylobacterium sp. 4-46]|nr:hypothetical protein M446_1469 [Methylobacterium sp. 4-46]
MEQDSPVLSPAESKTIYLSLGIILDENLVLVARNPLPERLRYSWPPVKAYLASNCSPPTNDCPDNVFSLDCTHFVAHALNKSGVFVKVPSADCASGLCIRVNDLAAAFHNSVEEYLNVTQIRSHQETREGDFCFIPSWFGLSKEHAMVLHSPATPRGARVYAHTNSRCGDYVSFEGQSCVYYRISAAAS